MPLEFFICKLLFSIHKHWKVAGADSHFVSGHTVLLYLKTWTLIILYSLYYLNRQWQKINAMF